MEFRDIQARLHDGRHIRFAQWQLQPGEYWAITGTNGSGKTALSCLFANQLVLSHGSADGLPGRVAYVSLEAQAAQIELERKQDQSDLNDCPDHGTRVRDLLAPLEAVQHWVELLAIDHLLDQGFRALSTGESRKVLWIRCLHQQPDLLVLDEPLEGLDSRSRDVLQQEFSACNSTARRLSGSPTGWMSYPTGSHTWCLCTTVSSCIREPKHRFWLSRS